MICNGTVTCTAGTTLHVFVTKPGGWVHDGTYTGVSGCCVKHLIAGLRKPEAKDAIEFIADMLKDSDLKETDR